MTNVDQIKDKAKGVIIDQVDRRTTNLGNVVSGHVSNLRQMGSSLRTDGQDATASLVDMAADRLNRVATYLTQTDGDRIIHDLENVARRQPVVMAAAGLLFGLTAARLLKTGAAQRYRAYVDADTTSDEETIADMETEYGVR